jgi:hypothetical protein
VAACAPCNDRRRVEMLRKASRQRPRERHPGEIR